MKRILLASLALTALFIIGCGSAKLFDAPLMTSIEVDETSVIVFWETNPDIENHDDFQGYNIYVYTDSSALLVENGEDLNKYNNEVITDTMCEVTGLSQDSVYYIQVRTLNTDNKVGGYNSTTPFMTVFFTVLAAPRMTSIIMHETSITVFWEKNSSVENNMYFSGYNIYVYTDSSELLVIEGEGLNPFNTAVITDTFFDVTGLTQDSIYYIQVRTVNTDNEVGSYNSTTPFMRASPRPEFTVVINFEINNPGVDDSCAIRFSDAMIMADSAMVNGGADMWVGYWGVAPDDTVAFASPNYHSQYGANARETYFINLGQYGFDDIYEIAAEPSQNYVVVVADDLVAAKTEDGNYVKIHVDQIDKVNFNITLTYAFQNIVGFPYF